MAKKWSEAPSGVGRRTDVIVLWTEETESGAVVRKKEFLDGCQVLKKLERHYETEKATIEHKRKKLKEELSKFF